MEITEKVLLKEITLFMAVAKDGFFKTGRCEGVLKNVVLEPLPLSRGCAAFLHNVVIVHELVSNE